MRTFGDFKIERLRNNIVQARQDTVNFNLCNSANEIGFGLSSPVRDHWGSAHLKNSEGSLTGSVPILIILPTRGNPLAIIMATVWAGRWKLSCI